MLPVTRNLLTQKPNNKQTKKKSNSKSKVKSAAKGSGQVIKKFKKKNPVATQNLNNDLIKNYQVLDQQQATQFNHEPMSLVITPIDSTNQDISQYLGNGVIIENITEEQRETDISPRMPQSKLKEWNSNHVANHELITMDH